MREKLRAFGRTVVRSWQWSLAWGVSEVAAMAVLTVKPDLWWVRFVWLGAVLYFGYRAALSEANDFAPVKVWIVGRCVVWLPLFTLWIALAPHAGVELPDDFAPLSLPSSLFSFTDWSHFGEHGAGLLLLLGGLWIAGSQGKDHALDLIDRRRKQADTSA